jgi:hypothetical protein
VTAVSLLAALSALAAVPAVAADEAYRQVTLELPDGLEEGEDLALHLHMRGRRCAAEWGAVDGAFAEVDRLAFREEGGA